MASENPLLKLASDAAASASLAQAEQLTGIPFFQAQQKRQEKRAVAGEAVASNRSRLQAGLSGGLVSQKFVDATPGGFDALAKDPNFDKAFAEGMRVHALDRAESEDVKTDLENAQLAWKAQGIKGEMPTDAHGARLQVADAQRSEIDQTNQNERAGQSAESFAQNMAVLDNLQNPTEKDIAQAGQLLQDQLKSLDAQVLANPDVIAMLKTQAIQRAELTGRSLNQRVKSRQVARDVDNKDFTWLQSATGEEITSAKSIPSTANALALGDTTLKTLATTSTSEEIIAELRQSDDPNITATANLLMELGETGKWSMQELGQEDPELAKRVMDVDLTKFQAANQRANFVVNDLMPAQVALQEQLDALPEEISSIIYPGGVPQASDLIRETPGAPGEGPSISGIADSTKDFRDRLATPGAISTEDIRELRLALREGGIGASSPLLKGLDEAIENQLVSRIRSAEYDPGEAAIDNDELLFVGSEMEVNRMLGQELSGLLAETATVAADIVPFDFSTPAARGVQAREKSASRASLQKDVYVPGYADLTTRNNALASDLDARLTTLATDIQNTSDPVRAAEIQQELQYVQGEKKNVDRRNILGPPITAIVASLGTGGYTGTAESLNNLLGPMFATDGANLSTSQTPQAQALNLLFQTLTESTTQHGRETALNAIIEFAAPVIVASTPEAANAGLTVPDFLQLWEEQRDISESAQMGAASTQFAQGDFDTIRKADWSTLPDENAWKIMHQMGRQQ